MRKIAVTGANGQLGKAVIEEYANDTQAEVIALTHQDMPIESLDAVLKGIESEKPEIRYLVNNAGVARMKPVSDFTLEEISDMLDINDKAATLICRACIPYMVKGSYILNVASASAFQPNPYIALYSASKAYLLSFTRSLNVENESITCTAVCPGWVDTKMLPKQRDGKDIRYPGMTPASKVVEVALKDCHKGKDVSVCSFYFRYMRFLSKVTPHSIAMKMWVKAIRQYI